MDRPNITILASGEGTTAEAVITACAEERVDYMVSLVIASKEDAGICKRVSELNKKYGLQIECRVALNDDQIQQALDSHRPNLIALMGYMKKIGPQLVQKYGWRPEYSDATQAMMLNTHPGLLPATKGMYGINVQRYVIESGLPHGGQALHVVSENYDEGPIVAEHKVAVETNDTPEKLFEKVKAAEKQHLPTDINKFLAKRQLYLKAFNG